MTQHVPYFLKWVISQHLSCDPPLQISKTLGIRVLESWILKVAATCRRLEGLLILSHWKGSLYLDIVMLVERHKTPWSIKKEGKSICMPIRLQVLTGRQLELEGELVAAAVWWRDRQVDRGKTKVRLRLTTCLGGVEGVRFQRDSMRIQRILLWANWAKLRAPRAG